MMLRVYALKFRVLTEDQVDLILSGAWSHRAWKDTRVYRSLSMLIEGMGSSLVWFGIITVIGAEIGLLTPPLGISCFALKTL